jgi:predicted DsbA family dithiol-disulfide isomerase
VAELGGNDAFWQFADNYFAIRAGGDQTDHATLMARLATEAGVDSASFASCLENEETINLVQEDLSNATETGGRGTPWSILIGPSGKTYPINGALPKQAVEQLIDLALQEA